MSKYGRLTVLVNQSMSYITTVQRYGSNALNSLNVKKSPKFLELISLKTVKIKDIEYMYEFAGL